MTPERWREVGELFKAAVRIDPAGREPWLGAACGGDEELRAEVGRLLAQDERADRVGLLTPPEPTGPPAERTTSWPARAEAPPPEPGPPGFRTRSPQLRLRPRRNACP
jgi:serine/threonine-protein kinase